jgi:hypothetical protein
MNVVLLSYLILLSCRLGINDVFPRTTGGATHPSTKLFYLTNHATSYEIVVYMEVCFAFLDSRLNQSELYQHLYSKKRTDQEEYVADQLSSFLFWITKYLYQ